MEKQQQQKGLSLDPHGNHQHRHLPSQNRNRNENREEEEEEEEDQELVVEEEEEDQELSAKQHPLAFHGFVSPHHHHQLAFGLDFPPPVPVPQPPKKRSYLPSTSEQNKEEYARLRDKMGESHQPTSSRFGLRNTGGGEIVEVQGGHIVRSTGRKDRHSKVCTAKGPRDRRVRLSAHTAIQFYDVQDRLGYDRPSKAVDWLIKKAKVAIDELAELPAWKPTNCSTATVTTFEQNQEEPHQQQQQHHMQIENENQQSQLQMNNHENSSSFLPPSLDSDSIADTIKSFFPMGASSAPNSSAMQFQSFPPPDLLSRTSSQNQDLRLSLQFQDPMLLHHHHNHPTHQNEQANLYSGPTQLSFDGSGWSEHPAWGGGGGSGGSGGGGFVFNSPNQTMPFLQPLFGQTQMYASQQQRGPLQSSNTHSVRAWIDPPPTFSSGASVDHHQTFSFHPSSMSGGIGFASGGGFSGFRIPARIQGEEEEHDGVSDKPSSASSDSRH